MTTIFVSKTKIKSDFELYWRGPRKTDPKKMKETTTQGSNLLVDSSITCKNHTHMYEGRNTNQQNFLIQNKDKKFLGLLKTNFSLSSQKQTKSANLDLNTMESVLNGQVLIGKIR
jgi:hypothetical protein